MAGTAFSLLRQRLGHLTGGVVVGTPTGGLTTTTFNATALSTKPDDFYNDWHGRFYEGRHNGVNFEVEDFVKLNGKVTLEPPTTLVIEKKDLFELYKHATPVELGHFINIAISMVAGEALVERVSETLLIPNSTTYHYAVPAGIAYIDRIYMEQGTAGRYGAEQDPFDYRAWRILHTTPPQIWFDPNLVSLTAARHLRLVGQAIQVELVGDSDECVINQAYVLYQAKALWHESKIRDSASDFEDHRTQMVIAQSRADSEREGLRVAPMGRAV